ncbi:MAG: hypothetical protein NTY01_05535 [Verrucomicrobia bacterium]|nr:hypothetical protein [Verrucomicrobiota bacterium]
MKSKIGNPKSKMPSLRQDQLDVLLLLKDGAAVSVDELIKRALAARFVLSPEMVEAALRDCFRAGLVTMRNDLWSISAKGLQLNIGG